MKPATTFRIVAIRTDDGTRKVLCDDMHSEVVSRRIADSLKGCIPFTTVVMEVEDAPAQQNGQRRHS